MSDPRRCPRCERPLPRGNVGMFPVQHTDEELCSYCLAGHALDWVDTSAVPGELTVGEWLRRSRLTRWWFRRRSSTSATHRRIRTDRRATARRCPRSACQRVVGSRAGMLVACRRSGQWQTRSLSTNSQRRWKGAPFRWWVSGRAHALQAPPSVHHGDPTTTSTSVSSDPMRRSFVACWEGRELCVAAAGALHAWDGRPLVAAHEENNVWARRPGADVWWIDITISDGTSEE